MTPSLRWGLSVSGPTTALSRSLFAPTPGRCLAAESPPATVAYLPYSTTPAPGRDRLAQRLAVTTTVALPHSAVAPTGR